MLKPYAETDLITMQLRIHTGTVCERVHSIRPWPDGFCQQHNLPREALLLEKSWLFRRNKNTRSFFQTMVRRAMPLSEGQDAAFQGERVLLRTCDDVRKQQYQMDADEDFSCLTPLLRAGTEGIPMLCCPFQCRSITFADVRQ